MAKDKIVSILKENGLYYDDLYDDDRSIILITNEEDDFLKNYKINKSSINNLPKNILRSDGILILDSVPYVISKAKEEGHNLKYWILFNNGCRALLKRISWVKIQNELLFKYLCNWLDIPCANIDACYLESTKMLISPSFLGIDEKPLDYYKKNIERLMKGNNETKQDSLTERVNSLSYYSASYTKQIDIKHLIKMATMIKQDFFIKKVILVDMLAHNQDRFPRNIKIIGGKKGIRICPLFDHEILEINGENLCVEMMPSINGSTNYDDIINYLLKDDEFRSWCLEKILLRQMPDFRKMIYCDKNIYVDDNVLESFNKTINDGRTIILDNYKYK